MASDPVRGYALLRNPRTNRGTAFSEVERRNLGLEGLLPPVPTTLERQVARIHAQLAALDSDLQKYLALSDLQARNETLYYAVLMSNPAAFMPIVYTPTVGEACQKFDHIFHNARGLYLPISAKGRVRDLLLNWPQKDVRFIVVTDGERILGLGDLGVGGMGIPIGKLALYTACAGVPPELCLPVVLDVGTNNASLLEDPLYLGLRQSRVRGEAYDGFVDEFVQAVEELYPKCCIQWEDFANINAVPILARYRNRTCTYNDDIQGTAAVALAGIYGALRISGQKLSDQRFLFLGAGSAATGIAELISQAMVMEGLTLQQARGRNNLFDVAIVAAFGVIGAILLALEFPLSPIVLGFVLGPMLEPNFRRAMLLSRGELSVFVTRPVAAGFVAASTLLVLVQVVAWWRGRGKVV